MFYYEQLQSQRSVHITFVNCIIIITFIQLYLLLHISFLYKSTKSTSIIFYENLLQKAAKNISCWVKPKPYYSMVLEKEITATYTTSQGLLTS